MYAVLEPGEKNHSEIPQYWERGKSTDVREGQLHFKISEEFLARPKDNKGRVDES